ncbi:carboxylesterase [Flammula alnicola]|nr:carboxylesterase [Flammula alnicola]
MRRFNQRLIAFLALLNTSPHAFGAAAQGDGLLIQTEQGPVSGTFAASTVRQFLGIPYALAPRWEAPTQPPARSSTFEATTFGDSCVQLLNAGAIEFLTLVGIQNIAVPESEDCLSANIWAPSVSRKQNTAVLVWIYGGSFSFGTSNTAEYNGSNFVRDNDDITIVTLNYRLNIFGQPNAPQLASQATPQNFGLLDVDAAVQWVHDNIAAFGGDPERISLFGQSAGSGAVDAYTFAHPQDTIVKGVIEQSGTCGALSIFPPTVNGTAWNTVATTVGCGNTSDATQLTCMKAVPFRTLENALISTNTTFSPVTDNVTMFSDTTARAATGNFLKVPLLGGSTLNEFDIFLVASELLSMNFTIPILTQAASDLFTQIIFTCPAAIAAQQRFSAGVPTWRYQYQAVFPNISPRPDLRAYHASEIPIVFGTYNTSPFGPPTPDEIALSKYMQAAWVAFAKDPTHGLVEFGWPLYTPGGNTLAVIGNPLNATGVLFTPGILVGLSCGVISLVSGVTEFLASIFA